VASQKPIFPGDGRKSFAIQTDACAPARDGQRLCHGRLGHQLPAQTIPLRERRNKNQRKWKSWVDSHVGSLM